MQEVIDKMDEEQSDSDSSDDDIPLQRSVENACWKNLRAEQKHDEDNLESETTNDEEVENDLANYRLAFEIYFKLLSVIHLEI